MKIRITKYTKKTEDAITRMESMISLDGIKPYELPDDEWEAILLYVNEIVAGTASEHRAIVYENGCFDLFRIENDLDAGILAESKNYYILRVYEVAELYRKPDSKYIASVGDFYGEPDAAYIDPEEKFCITIGSGIIKYNLCEPFEGYMYNRSTAQWIETGRKGNIEWCDHIDEVTDDYIAVSLEGMVKRKYDIHTLSSIKTTSSAERSKEKEIWISGDTAWINQMFQPLIEGRPEFPVKCPACGEASGHIYINRDGESHRGGAWAWCSNCHMFAHWSTNSVPDWWVNSSRVDEDKLCAADPEELVQYEAVNDDSVNYLMLHYGMVENACRYCLHKEYHANPHISECPKCGKKTLTGRLSGPEMISTCSNCGFEIVGASFFPPCHTDELDYTVTVSNVEKNKKVEVAKLFGLNVMTLVNRINEYGEVTRTAKLFDAERLYLTLKELGVEVEVSPDFRRKFPDLIGCKVY